MKHAPALLLSATAVLLAVVGCSTPSGGSPDELPQVSIDEYSDLTAVLDYEHGTYSQPTDQYSADAPELAIREVHALAVQTDVCLEEKGFPPIADDVDWSPSPKPEDRFYGRWSTTYASNYGFDLAPETNTNEKESDLPDRGPEFTDALIACDESAKQELVPQFPSQLPNIIRDIRSQAHQRATNSEEGKKARADWIQCAEDAGIVLDPENGDGPSHTYAENGKEAEIAAAVTYAECAKSTGAIQTIANLIVRYETALMETQEAKVAAFAKERADAIAQLDAVILG